MGEEVEVLLKQETPAKKVEEVDFFINKEENRESESESESVGEKTVVNPRNVSDGNENVTILRNSTTLGSYVVRDHFSLENPSSTLQFGGNENVIFTVGQSQIVLERNLENNTITAKQIVLETPGLYFLRGFYTLIAFLFAGFMFIFFIQVILSLVLSLAVDAGLMKSKNAQLSFVKFIGSLFVIPAFTLFLANEMTLAVAFVADSWNGNKFMKTMVAWDSVAIDWFTTIVFIVVPFFVGGIFLLIGTDDWWGHTLLAWFICIWAYYMVFWACTIYHEVDGCLQLIRYSHSSPLDFDPDDSKLSWKVIRASILMKIKASFSGNQTALTINVTSSRKEETEPKKGFFTMFTFLLVKCGLYTELEEPKLQHDLDLVRGYTPYVTSSTWGLEKLYCRNHQTRYVAIVGGPAALNRRQVESSFACFFLGFLIQLFVSIAFMVWMKLRPGAIGIICAIYVLYFFQKIRKTIGLRQTYDKLEDDASAEGKAIYQAKEINRITEPTDGLCWVFLSLEIVLMFLFPFSALVANGSAYIVIYFSIISIVTFVRRYLNSSIAIREFGSLEGIEDDNVHQGTSAEALDEEYREKNRLGKIVADISSGRKKGFWQSVFVILMITACLLFVMALVNVTRVNDTMKSTTKFEYQGGNNLEYASCSVLGEFTAPDDPAKFLVDFTFLSRLAYEDSNDTNRILNEWFDPSGNGTVVAVDHEDVVQAFKNNYTSVDGVDAVSYKFLGFPKAGVGVVAIKGSSNGWDAYTDAMLWSSAALAQCLRASVPWGGIFTPILKYLLKVIELITTRHLNDLAFYVQITEFVKFTKSFEDENGVKYSTIIITGHSLGGGLAMISGAQSKVPAVALSGPNAVLSRLTFTPAISKEQLDKYTFNIVPDRDIIPRVDDLAQNYQRIQCRSHLSNFLSCHSRARSLCEVLLQCGSKGRPIPCDCVNKYEDIYKDNLNKSASNNGETLEQECPN